MTDHSQLVKQLFRGEPPAWAEPDVQAVDRFLAYVGQQGLAPLVHHCLVRSGESASLWPDALRERVRQDARQEAAVEMLRRQDLVALLARMGEEGIRPLLIKGTPLAYTLYPEPVLRPRCDTDLLIAPGDKDRVICLFEHLGYRRLFESSGEFHSTQTTFHRQGRLGIAHAYDIHWQISNSSRVFSEALNYTGLIARAADIPELGENAWTLDPVDALLLACFHRAGHFAHSGDRLIWLYDIHRLSRSLDDAGFDRFQRQATDLGIRYLCADAILTARDWFATELPDRRLEQLSSVTRDESTAALLESGREQGIRNRTRLELAGLSSNGDKLRYLWQQLFPSADFMVWRYGIAYRALLPFYYLRRLVEGVGIFLRRR